MNNDAPLIEKLEQLGQLRPTEQATTGAMDRVRRQLAAVSAP